MLVSVHGTDSSPAPPAGDHFYAGSHAPPALDLAPELRQMLRQPGDLQRARLMVNDLFAGFRLEGLDLAHRALWPTASIRSVPRACDVSPAARGESASRAHACPAARPACRTLPGETPRWIPAHPIRSPRITPRRSCPAPPDSEFLKPEDPRSSRGLTWAFWSFSTNSSTGVWIDQPTMAGAGVLGVAKEPGDGDELEAAASISARNVCSAIGEGLASRRTVFEAEPNGRR